MSNNSVVTPDGEGIGRAEVVQAAAARVEPEAAMNPVLLKPGGEDSSQVVFLGRAVADVTALSYRLMKAALLEQVLASLEDLRARFDVVRSEEHTSELQSRQYLVCRLLLEKKKKKYII